MTLARLRAGEWLTAASVTLMALALFVLHWYTPVAHGFATYPPGPSPRTGWQALTHLRWLLLVAMALGAALVITQAAFRAPAIPVSLDVISTVIAVPTLLWLILRVVIDAFPGQQAGAWLELLGAVGLLVGSFLALRREGIREADGPGEIPLVELPAGGGGQTGGPAPAA